MDASRCGWQWTQLTHSGLLGQILAGNAQFFKPANLVLDTLSKPHTMGVK
jgi:hypothetical protein